MSIYDLPKTGFTIFKAKDELDIGQIIYSALRNEKNCILHHEFFDTWIKTFFSEAVEKSTFVSFSEECPVPNPEEFKDAKNVIIADFDLYLEIFGLFPTMKLINSLRKTKRVFITCSSELKEIKALSTIADSIYTIGNTSNDGVNYVSSTLLYDKKGRFTIQDDDITMMPNAKPVVKKNKNKEDDETEISMDSLQAVFDAGTDMRESEKAARDALQLPFIASRQEDGVAIRDAARKKIRIGGQIIYEPDQADDLDDSDPDDDLNI